MAETRNRGLLAADVQNPKPNPEQEKRRTQQLLRTFLHVRTTLGGAMPSK